MKELESQRDVALSTIQDLESQINIQESSDDNVMIMVRKQIAQWKEELSRKDAEAEAREQVIVALKEYKETSAPQREKKLQAKIAQREAEINELGRLLNEATSELSVLEQKIKTEKPNIIPGEQTLENLQKIVDMKDDELRRLEQLNREREKEFVEVSVRLNEYENNNYGLADAVAEIKKVKGDIIARDTEIGDLLQEVSNQDSQLQVLSEVNDELRRRLGLEEDQSVDVSELRLKRKVEIERLKALNRQLSRDIESLEQERIELKSKLRHAAMDRGEHGVSLGLSSEQMAVIENAEDSIAKDRANSLISHNIAETQHAVESNLKGKISSSTQLEDALQMYKDRVKYLENELGESNTKRRSIEDELRLLRIGSKELKEKIAHFNDGSEGKATIESPALDRLLEIWSSVHPDGVYDVNISIKNDVNKLHGANSELKKRLQHVEAESRIHLVENQRLQLAKEKLENDMKDLKSMYEASTTLRPLSLPDGMPLSSSDIIAALNEHLIQILQELYLKEKSIQDADKKLAAYNVEIDTIKAQFSLAYEHQSEKIKKRDEIQVKHEKKIEDLKEELEKSKAKCLEFDKLQATISSCERGEWKHQLAEYAGRMNLLVQNEIVLKRRYTVLESSESNLKKQNSKLRNDISQIQKTMEERILYLTQYKEIAQLRISSLQSETDSSVNRAEFNALQDQCDKLADKYRTQLEKAQTYVEASTLIDKMKVQLKDTTEEVVLLQKKCLQKDEIITALNSSLESSIELTASHKKEEKSEDTSEYSVSEAHKKINAQEIASMNERHRAEMAETQIDHTKLRIKQVEDRNMKLQVNFESLLQSHTSLQKQELKLQTELSKCISRDRYNDLEQKYKNLEDINIRTHAELLEQRRVASIASKQTEMVKVNMQTYEKEIDIYRKQIREMEIQSDVNVKIGSLNREILQLQLSESQFVFKEEQFNVKLLERETEILKLKRLLDEKDEAFFQYRCDAKSKMRYIRRTAALIRQQYAGAISLEQQEKFTISMQELRENKDKMETELLMAKNKKSQAESKVILLDQEQKNVKELVETINSSTESKQGKLLQWHKEVSELRLEQLEGRRTLDQMAAREKYLETLNSKLEERIRNMESEAVEMRQEYDKRQLSWENRENDLEKMLERSEHELHNERNQINLALRSTEEVYKPDPNQSLASQLEGALNALQLLGGGVAGLKNKLNQLESRNEQLTIELKEKSVCSSSTLDDLKEKIEKREEKLLNSCISKKEEEKNANQRDQASILKIAQQTIGSLQKLLKEKEESLERTRQLLNNSTKNSSDERKRLLEKIKDLNLKIQEQEEHDSKEWNTRAIEIISKNEKLDIVEVLTREKVALEDDLHAQQQMCRHLSDNLQTQRKNYENKIKMQEESAISSQNKMNEKHLAIETELKESTDKMLILEKELEDKNKQILSLENTLAETIQEATKGPSAKMKALVNNLRREQKRKDEQIETLVNAVADMEKKQNQLSTNITALSRQSIVQSNVDETILKESRELKPKKPNPKEEIKSLSDKLAKTKISLNESNANLLEKEKELKENSQKLEESNAKVFEFHRKWLKCKENMKRTEIEWNKRIEAQKERNKKEKESIAKLQKQIDLLIKEKEDLEKAVGALKSSNDHDERKTAARITEMSLSNSSKEVQLWELEKKFRQKNDNLKEKLKNVNNKAEALNISLKSHKELLNKKSREVNKLESQIKLMQKSLKESQKQENQKSFQKEKEFEDIEAIHIIQTEKAKLEDALMDVRKRLEVDMVAKIKRLELENLTLQESKTNLEKKISPRDGSMKNDIALYKESKELEFQKKLADLEAENLELKWKIEESVFNTPRLKERLSSLENYVSALQQHTSSNCKKENPEILETLKKVNESLKKENIIIKNDSISGSNLKFMNLKKENKRLKAEVQEARLRVTELSKNKSIPKSGLALAQENGKLKIQLKKERETKEKMRDQLQKMSVIRDRLIDDASDLRRSVGATLDGSVPGLDQSNITELYEANIRQLTIDLQKQGLQCKELKKLLQKAGENESLLLAHQKELEEELVFLKSTPEGNHLNNFGSKKVKELEIAEQRIKELNEENKSLKSELSVLDPKFFEEIEDLKYNYEKATMKVERMRQQLQDAGVTIKDDQE
eukprot:UC4_evm2s146